MKRPSRWILVVGDWIVLSLLAFYVFPYISNPARPNLELAASLVPVWAAWVTIGVLFRIFDVSPTPRSWVMRNLLALPIIVALGLGLRSMAALLLLGVHTSWISNGVTGMVGVLAIGAWRTAFFLGDWILGRLSPPRRSLVMQTVLAIGLGLVFFLLLPRVWVMNVYSSKIDPPEMPAGKSAALVFGSRVWSDGSPSAVLIDRVETAAELYHAGQVGKIIMTGDGRPVSFNEPQAMQRLAIKLSVPASAIVLDNAGYRTYDSCYRAAAVFGVRQAILVTQRFHLGRALYLCNSLGITSIGVSADRRRYTPQSILIWNLRETAATVSAWWDLNISHPLPSLNP